MQITAYFQTVKYVVLIAPTWLLSACALIEHQTASARVERATALFQQHCRGAGEKIYETVDDVEGVFLIKVRPEGLNWGHQYKLDDPYGSDLGGDGYIESFLRRPPLHQSENDRILAPKPRSGYAYVEAIDPNDGKLYRYTGHWEEPWQTNKHYLKGYFKFVLERVQTTERQARYGVTYDDISTREDRDHWIAGSRLQVIDTQTDEVLAERIGFMVDAAQGSRVGGRSPWLLASNNSCPSFGVLHASVGQLGQTERFVKKVLLPKP